MRVDGTSAGAGKRMIRLTEPLVMSDTEKNSGGGDTAVLEPPAPKAKPAAPKTDPKNKPKRQPPYAVIVENDDDHTYQYVILGLCKVCGHSVEKAFKLASDIDHN